MQRLDRSLALAVLALSVASSAPRATAQLCTEEWLRFPTSGVRGTVYALEEHDDGTGNALFIGGNALGAEGTTPLLSGLMRWSGGALEPLHGGLCNAMTRFDLGSGSELVVGGAFDLVPPVSGSIEQVLRWNGTAFAPLGSASPSTTAFQANHVLALSAFDDGGGTALYAGGGFQVLGGAACLRIGRWNGNAWEQVGAGFGSNVNALCQFDDGGGARLYAGGNFTNSGATPLSRIARWDGASWQPVGGGFTSTVLSLAVFDAGAGPRLYAGTQGTSFAVWRLDGNTWTHVGTTNGSVQALRVESVQGVARLYASGDFTTIGGIAAEHVAAYDGVQWSALASGLRSSTGSVHVQALHGFDRGQGRELFAGGTFHSAGAMTARGIAGWNGLAWSGIGPSTAPGAGVLALANVPFGSERVLAVGGVFHTVGDHEARHVALWNGSSWTTLGNGLGLAPLTFASFDDGTGPTLFAGGGYDGAGGPSNSFVERWNGTTWSSISNGLSALVRALAVHDDGSGSALYAAGYAPTGGGSTPAGVKRWNGSSWTLVGGSLNGAVHALVPFDDRTETKLYAVGHFTSAGGVPASSIAAWNGTAWSSVGGGLTDGAGGWPPHAFAACVHDDGSGPRLFVCGQFTRAGGVFTNGVAAWNGTSWSATAPGAPGEVYAMNSFTTAEGPALVVSGFVGSGSSTPHTWKLQNGSWSATFEKQVTALAAYDSGAGGGEALYVNVDAPDSITSPLSALAGCALDGGPFCAGDGADPVATNPCPCGNQGGTGRGCANSVQPLGALLSALGATAEDEVELVGTSMPVTAPCVFLKGDAVEQGGVVFGDGLRCVGGNLIRLGTLISSGGRASYPGPGQTSVSTRGQTPPGSGLLANYQIYYRNAAAAFCPPALFNVTNGWQIVW